MKTPLWNQQFFLVRSGGIVIIDAGANEGQSVEKYRTWWPDAAVHCFEPDPRAMALLKRGWGGRSNIKLYQEALGDTEEALRFGLGHNSCVSSILPRIEGYIGGLPIISSTEVYATTIDKFVVRERIPYINILKMDLQGFELKALQGAKDSLKEEIIDIVFVEVWLEPTYQGAPYYWEIAQYVASFGYKTWGIEVKEYPNETEGRWGDVIFVSRRYAKILGYGSSR